MLNIIPVTNYQRDNTGDDVDIGCLKQHYDSKFCNFGLVNHATKSAKSRVEFKYLNMF